MNADLEVPHPCVRCPFCADEFVWPGDDTVSIFDEETARYELKDISRYSSARQADLRRSSYVRCPNPSEDMPPHFLPATYSTYRDPLIIGIVGAPSSGKTHLLTAMIRAAYQLRGLVPYGVQTAALDFRRHDHFQHRFVRPFEAGHTLPGTSTGIIEAADILLLRGPGGNRPVTFFDVAGEDFESTEALNRGTRFLVGANALIFVHALEDPLKAGRHAAANSSWSFDLAVERLQGLPGGAERIPAAIAVTKSDRMRYVPPIDRWLRREDAPALAAGDFRAETRDVYAYLHHVGSAAALRPYETFRRCTMHFVSASGGDAVPVDPSGRDTAQYFPRGVRPANVLAPLIAILAMSGVIRGQEAEKVGFP